MKELLQHHEDIVTQNKNIENNLSSIPKLTKKIEATSHKK
ncbi:hypothetical protein SBY92_002157 [Candida maltosa Xu316]